jgi:hypothetical protein
MVHGAAVHCPAHPPLEHEQLLFVHCVALRGAPASRVSGIGGPPFGLASGTFDPDPPHPTHNPKSTIAS